MSPLNSLRGRKKEEEGGRKTLEPQVRHQGRTKLHLLLCYCVIVHIVIIGGRVDLFTHKVTAIVKLYCYS